MYGVDLSGKVALVTGAGRGVGRAISVTLAAHGARVALVGRGTGELAAVQAEIAAAGGVALAFPCDVTHTADVVERLKGEVEEAFGPPGILVNNAGVFGPIALLAEGDVEQWVQTVMVNTVGPYLTCRAFVGGMVRAGWGRVINVSSAASLAQPGPYNSAYATSKVALNHMTRCLAAELAGTGVTAHVIHPGEVKTEMWRDIKGQTAGDGAAGTGLRSWAALVEATGGDPPEKAADLALRLMGDDATLASGQFLWIEGGLQSPIETGW